MFQTYAVIQERRLRLRGNQASSLTDHPQRFDHQDTQSLPVDL